MKGHESQRFQIDRDSPERLVLQICRQARDLILSGALPAGASLPPTRQAARLLGVSRNTLADAYGQLAAEGYVEARQGSGTFVAQGMAPVAEELPQRAALPGVDYLPHRFDVIDFRAGVPDTARFPVAVWKSLCRTTWDEMTPLDLAYRQPEGRVELRREVARSLGTQRGMRCHPEQVLITTGTEHAVTILNRILLRGERTTCILEDPGSLEIARSVAASGGKVRGVPVDRQGLVTEALPTDILPAMVYVSPSHQYPLGVTLPLARRLALLSYARQKGTMVVENDADGALVHRAHPPAALQGMDPARVIHIGSFASTLLPSLAIGYLILPPSLVAAGREAKWSLDFPNATADQLVLARFITKGFYDKYLRTMRGVYRKARALLEEALARHFGDQVSVLGAGSGLHLCAQFSGVKFTAKVLNRINLAGVGVYPVEECALRKGRWENALVLGYGMLDTRRISTGISILKRCVPS